MKEDEKKRPEKHQTTSTTSYDNQSSIADTDNEFTSDASAGVIKAVQSLGKNGPYIFAELYGTLIVMLQNGFVAFGAKYVEQQFGLTSSFAGITFGTSTVAHGRVCIIPLSYSNWQKCVNDKNCKSLTLILLQNIANSI